MVVCLVEPTDNVKDVVKVDRLAVYLDLTMVDKMDNLRVDKMAGKLVSVIHLHHHCW